MHLHRARVSQGLCHCPGSPRAWLRWMKSSWQKNSPEEVVVDREKDELLMARFQSVNGQNQGLSGSIGSTRTSWRPLLRAFTFSVLSLLLLCPHSCYHPGFVPYFLHPTMCLCPCGSSQDSEEAGKSSIAEASRTRSLNAPCAASAWCRT